MKSSTTSSSEIAASCSSSATILSRAFKAGSEWPDKEEFLDVIYWARQILGIALGLFWGLLGVRGANGLVGFTALNAGIVYAYYSGFQAVDEEVVS